MPTVDIPDKICPHCGGTKWFHNPKLNTYTCKVKRIKSFKAFYNRQSKDYHNLKMKKYREENKEKYSLYVKEYTQKHNKTENRIKQVKSYSKNRVTSLSDSYIRDQIRQSLNNSVTFSDIPQELIELKRKQLLLKRQIKQNGKK